MGESFYLFHFLVVMDATQQHAISVVCMGWGLVSSIMVCIAWGCGGSLTIEIACRPDLYLQHPGVSVVCMWFPSLQEQHGLKNQCDQRILFG